MVDFNASSSDDNFCNFLSFFKYYSIQHGWIAILVCILGSIGNGVNIFVLTKREMRSSTSLMLTALAAIDLLVMIIYIPYAFYLYLSQQSRKDACSHAWTIFLFSQTFLAQVFQVI